MTAPKNPPKDTSDQGKGKSPDGTKQPGDGVRGNEGQGTAKHGTGIDEGSTGNEGENRGGGKR